MSHSGISQLEIVRSGHIFLSEAVKRASTGFMLLELAAPGRLELPTCGLLIRFSIRLRYGAFHFLERPGCARAWPFCCLVSLRAQANHICAWFFDSVNSFHHVEDMLSLEPGKQ